VPPATLERFVTARAGFERFPPSLLEAAVADLMEDGTLAAHIRRVRKLYRSARDTLTSSLELLAGDRLRIVKPAQGLHLIASLPDGLSVSAAAILAQSGIEARLVSETRLETRGPDGFILGFAGHSERDLRRAAEALSHAISAR
jgi:GntR family transcriptional regulator/MocR family aminotransferase